MHRTCFVLFIALFVTACTSPRIIVLKDPLGPREHNDLGVAYERRGEWDLAIREYRRAAEADARWSLPLVNLGNVHASRQQWEEARKSYLKALRRDRGDTDAMNNLAWVFLQEGDTDSALRWAWSASAKCPDRPEYLETLAEIHRARGEMEAARQIARRASSLSDMRQK